MIYLKPFDKTAPPLVLAGVEMLPLRLHQVIVFQFGVRFGKADAAAVVIASFVCVF